jgi:hypothetical protein
MTPSMLGDLGYQLAIVPASTSTAGFFLRTSDTGTVLTTSRILDLSRQLYLSVTGGKPLDATVHPRKGPQVPRSIAIALPLELVFHTSGINAYVGIAHKTRSAAAGAGSTWETIKTEADRRFKMGTDTDATFEHGVVSSVNAQAIKRFYKVNVTFKFRKASDTSAKDTSTNTELYVERGPLFLLGGLPSYPAQG